MKVVPVTIGPVRASGVPSLDSCIITTNRGRSDSITAGPISTVQVRIMSDPIGRMGLGLLLIKYMESGAGTKLRMSNYFYVRVYTFNCICILCTVTSLFPV